MPDCRPVFATPEGYVAYVREGLLTGERPFAPSTVFELAMLKSECPAYFAEVRPAPHDLALLIRQCRLWSMRRGDEQLVEAADTLEFDPAPQSDIEFDRLLLKLIHDDDAKAALSAVLAGGPVL